MKINYAQPIYQQVYTQFKQLILTGEFPPGKRIVMSQMADEYKISRTPLREAIRQLETEGLIIQDKSGLRVIKINKDDFTKLYQCRLLLEKEAVGMAVEKITEIEIEKAKAVLTKLEKAIDEQDHLEILELNTKFHQKIVACCENEHLLHLLDHVTSMLLIYRANINQKSIYNHQIHQEHIDIMEAIASRDRQKTVDLVEKHLLNDKHRGLSDF